MARDFNKAKKARICEARIKVLLKKIEVGLNLVECGHKVVTYYIKGGVESLPNSRLGREHQVAITT